MQTAIIVKTSRCIINGKFVLVGYDANDKFVFGIRHNAKTAASGIAWTRQSDAKTDLAKIKKAYDDYHASAAAEAAAR